jgi:hypothetical protein
LIMLLLPGWALLSMGQYWKRWQPLQRWFLALSLGIAVYPVMFYLTRAVLPVFRFGTRKLVFFLVISFVVIVWKQRKVWREHLRFEKLTWLALVVLVATLAARFILAHEHPFLAGDDSLHHTLLTELTAINGRLPYTLEPYDNTVLDHYHLGLYALTAPLKLLTGLRSDQALLWMCQFLNGIAGIGSFLILDKLLSRKSAIAGLAFVGLLSVFPNYYVNWGRFTQLAGQVLLFPAVIIYWEHLLHIGEASEFSRTSNMDWIAIFLSGLTAGAVCLLHFRVAAFLIPLMLSIFLIHLFSKNTQKPLRWKRLLGSLLITLFVLPALVPGLRAYINMRNPQIENNSEIPATKLSENWYYSKGDGTTNRLSEESKWLYLTCLIGIVWGFFKPKSSPLSFLMSVWLLVFLAITYAYLTNVSLLAIMNRTAVLLALYLPMSVGLGILVYTSETWFLDSTKNYSSIVLILILLLSLWSLNARLNEYWPEQEYMSEEDQIAMNWIKENTPKEAIFGANTDFLNPIMPYGTDAGYWIPFYGERETTTLTLLSSLTDNIESSNVLRADALYGVYSSPLALDKLCAFDISYLYSGAKPSVSGNDFNIDELLNLPGTSLVYDRGGVQVLEICK